MAMAQRPWAFGANKEAGFVRRANFSTARPAAGCHFCATLYIMVTKRVYCYKRLIELPAGRADAPCVWKAAGNAYGRQQL
jgi:hypothetical protein